MGTLTPPHAQTQASHSEFASQLFGISLVPRHLPEKRKDGLVFWMTFLVMWGEVERRKECN